MFNVNFEDLIDKLADTRWEARLYTVQALGNTKDPRAVEPLLHVLKDEDADVRASAAEALGNIGDARAIKPLVSTLKDEYYSVRSAVVGALKKLEYTDETMKTLLVALKKIYPGSWAEDVQLQYGTSQKSELLTALFDAMEEGTKTEDLVKIIGSDTPGRYDAIRALARSGDERAVDHLIGLLADRKEMVRRMAVTGLGNTGNVRAEKALISALKDEDVSVRREAVISLSKFRSPGVAGALKGALKDERRIVRWEAINALARLGTPEAVKVLIRLLKYMSPTSRWRVTGALHGIDVPGTTKLVAAALKDKDNLTRKEIANILDQRGWRPANKQEEAYYLIACREWEKLRLLGKDAVMPLVDLLADDVAAIRNKALRLLVKICGKQDACLLVNRLNDPDYLIRQGVAGALDKLSRQAANKNEEALYFAAKGEWNRLRALEKAAVGPLSNVLQDNGYPFRHRAAIVLGEIGDSDAIPALTAALEDREKLVREKAAHAIIKMADKSAINALITILKDNDLGLQDKAAEVLGKIGDSRAIRPLIAELRDDEDVVRVRAAAALDKMAWQPPNKNLLAYYLLAKQKWQEVPALGKDAVGPLIVFLKDKTNYIKTRAAEILGKIADPRAAAPLITVLDDKYSPARLAAAAALGQIGDRKAVEPLIKTIEDKDPEVRDAVAAALIKIGKIAKPVSLVAILKTAGPDVCRKVVEVLDGTGWQPRTNDDLSLYLLAKKEWETTPAARIRAVPVLIEALSSNVPEVRDKAVDALGDIAGSRAVEPLIIAQGIRDFDFQEKTLLALKKISKRVLAVPVGFLCKQCFLRYKRHKAEYFVSFENIVYYACPKCRCDFDFYADVDKVVLLLDRGFAKDAERRDKMLIVNWLKRREVFDYDEVWIEDAGDYDVERLVMKLKNDTDDERRQRLSSVPVRLGPGLNISPAKMNLLKDNFLLPGGSFEKPPPGPP